MLRIARYKKKHIIIKIGSICQEDTTILNLCILIVSNIYKVKFDGPTRKIHKHAVRVRNFNIFLSN